MNLKKSITALFFIFVINLIMVSNPIVKAEIDSSEYQKNDLIKVLVKLENNPGIHGIVFNLNYDDSILEFEGVRDGNLLRKVLNQSTLSYAFTDPLTSAQKGSHIIVSYSLKGKNTQTGQNGTLIEIRFRVHTADTLEHRFTFNQCALVDKVNQQIPDVTWQNSDFFKTVSPLATEYILIKKPYDNQIFYQDQLKMSIICSEGDYIIRVYNDHQPEVYCDIPVIKGAVLDYNISPVVLQPGFNQIKAELMIKDNSNNPVSLNVIDKVKVYRADNSKQVKILSPLDHSLINTDMVDVEVSSPFDHVEINGMTALATGETAENGDKIYHTRIWLVNGFNTIYAAALDESHAGDKLKYTDTIQVFYQKDDSIFKFIVPEADQVFKPTAYSKLLVKGEIDSPYKTGYDPLTGAPVKNSVTLRVIYQPLNPLLSPVTLIQDLEAKITENDYSSVDNSSQYIFYNDFDIPLHNLEDGEIIISAFKNKNGKSYDDLITRVVHIDNQRLWINLVQPNVFTSDELDNPFRIQEYNENIPLDPDQDIELSLDGVIKLANSEPLIKDSTLLKVNDILQAPDGTLYALTNMSNGTMKIYKKELSDAQWKLEISRSDMYGYHFCYSKLGILIGVSNLFTTDNSGLYLLNNRTLTNISLPDYLPDVQFVYNMNNTLYLYGNNYAYLYNFDLYSMEENNGHLMVFTIQKKGFVNNLNILQLALNQDASIAMIRTDAEVNNIFFYKKTASGYQQIELLENNKSIAITGNNVIFGEYATGEYYTYLIVKDDNQFEIIMANRNSGQIIRNSAGLNTFGLNTNAVLNGIGFKNDNFILAYNENGVYQIKKGKLFFNNFYPDYYEGIVNYTKVNPQLTFNIQNQNLFVSDLNEIYLGFGYHFFTQNTNEKMICFYKNLKTTGSAHFNYVNPDIDGLTGFEFNIDPRWLEYNHLVQFGFQVREKLEASQKADLTNDTLYFELSKTDLNELVDAIENNDSKFFATQNFTVTSNYDALLNKKIIHFEFKELQQNKYLAFSIGMNALENISPQISGIKIFKKMKAKIIAVPGTNITLPIHGYVYDRTVNEVEIQHNKVALGADGSFYYNYTVDTFKREIPVEISCKNGAGQRAVINFTVEITESYNNVWDVTYKMSGESMYHNLVPDPDANEFLINTDMSKIELSGKYYGLRNCILGYELIRKNSETNQDEILKRGLFQKNEITQTDNPVWSEIGVALSSSFEAGIFKDQIIDLYAGEQTLVIYCENPGGKRSEYGEWKIIHSAVTGNSQSDLTEFSDMRSEIIDNTLLVSGKFKAKKDAVLGFELYQIANNAQSQLMDKGFLSPELNSTADETGMVIRSFNNQPIQLALGKQQVVIYCENPDGYRLDYQYDIDKAYPHFNYNIPEADQKIDFNLDQTTDLYKHENIIITHRVMLNAYENAGPDYLFTREYEVNGTINSLFDFKTLMIKDISDYTDLSGRVLFANNQHQIEIPVEAGNRFNIKFKVIMGKNELNQTFHIAAIPTMAFKNNLKRGIEIVVRKEFEHTDFRADFDDMKQSKWTEDEIKNEKVKFRFHFNRDDLPLYPYTKAYFTLNYIHPFTGYTDKSAGKNGVYCLKDENGAVMELPISMLRVNAVNRLQWHFEYEDPMDKNIYLITSSTSGKEGMHDFIFNYDKQLQVIPTEILFSSPLQDIYYDNSNDILPDLTINKDEKTDLQLFLNNKPIRLNWQLQNGKEQFHSSFYQGDFLPNLIEGKNSLTVNYLELQLNGLPIEQIKQYTFLFDSLPPKVEIAAYTMETDISNENFGNLLSISALVTEANFNRGFLHFDNQIIPADPQIIIMGKDNYQLIWNDLNRFNIKPSNVQPVKIEARDHSGKSAFTLPPFTGLNQTEKPVESIINQNQFKMRLYDTDDGNAIIENEGNYLNKDFTQHTKFAPQKFMKKSSVKEHFINNQFIIMKDNTQDVPYNTELTIGDGTEKFMVIKIAQDPANNIYELEHINNGNIKFTASGLKLKNKAYLALTSGELNLTPEKDITFVKGYNHLYCIIKLYESSPLNSEIPNQTEGLRVRFYTKLKEYIDSLEQLEDEEYAEAKLTLTIKTANGTNIPISDIYLTGDVNSSFKDIVLYDPNYEDPEHYRVNVDTIVEQNHYALMNNLKGREQILYSENSIDAAKWGYSLALSDQYAVIGAPGDNNLNTKKSGAVYIYRKKNNGDWDLSSDQKIAPDEGDGALFGSAVAICNNYIIVGAHGIDAAYIYQKNELGNWQQIKKLKGMTNEEFGCAVAVNETNIIIGASNHLNKGAVYLYELNLNHEWQFNKIITGSDLAEGDQFGYALSLTQSNALIGSPGAGLKGKAYLWGKDSSGNWLEQKIMVPQAGDAGDRFGHAVSLQGKQGIISGNNDVIYLLEQNNSGGWQDAVKLLINVQPDSGNYAVSIFATYAAVGIITGKVYIFKRNASGSWLEDKELSGYKSTAADQFGSSVFLYKNDLLVGAPERQQGANKSGAAYFYRKSNGIDEKWGEYYYNFKKLEAVDDHSILRFGYSVNIAGDDAIVGVPYDDDYGSMSGSAYIYHRNGNLWEYSQKITSFDSAAQDFFGYSVVISDQYAFVSAVYDDDNGDNTGSVYIYKKGETGFSYQAKLIAPLVSNYDQYFGYSLALSGDYLIVGAPGDYHNGVKTGSAYIYKRNNNNWMYLQKLTADFGESFDQFGTSVSISGDYAVIGSIWDDDKGSDAGAAYIFKKNTSNVWLQTQKLTKTVGISNDYFGFSVDISNNYAIVGSINTGNNKGSALIYQLNSGVWQMVKQLSSGVAQDYFGRCVSISDEYAVVGAEYDNENGEGAGSAYLYKRDNTGDWSLIIKQLANDGVAYDYLGHCVALSGDFVIMGAYGDNSNKGSAYVYAMSDINSYTDTTAFTDYYSDLNITKNTTDNVFTDNIFLLPDSLTEYLVFKIKKYGDLITDISDIQNNIHFIYTASGYNYSLDIYKSYEHEIILNHEQHYFYDEKTDYLYFIVNKTGIQKIKDQIISELDLKQPFTGNIADWKVYDRGSLHINYTGKLKNYQTIDLYTAIHGRSELGTGRVADFSHDFYSLNSLDYQTDDYYLLHPAFRYTFDERSIRYNPENSSQPTGAMTVNFWLRLEDEAKYQKDSIYKDSARRVFTLQDAAGNEIFHVQYRFDKLELYKNDTPLTGEIESSKYGTLFTNDSKLDEWVLLSYVFDRKANIIKCSINGKFEKNITIDSNIMTRILSENAAYYFGNVPGGDSINEYNTGFFSIANAYYINEGLTQDQLTRLSNFRGRSVGHENLYQFRGVNTDIDQDIQGNKDGYGDLFLVASNDYYANRENADYRESLEGGALKASSAHQNFLINRQINGKNYLTFNGEGVTHNSYNLEVTPDVESNAYDLSGYNKGLLLAPKDSSSGRYFFGNKSSNYGLGQDRWYSISGYISELAEQDSAELVFSINNQEQRMKLRQGPFHFVYDNKNNLIPDNVNLYIETTGRIVIHNKVVLNMGNFTIPHSLQKSAASTFFAFDLSGSVHFWYKPLMTNDEGFVEYPLDLNGKSNFREMVLFDSELIKIGIKRKLDGKNGYYYAAFKNSSQETIEESNVLWSNKRITEGWQHIQVSYDLNKKTAFFYLNGELIASKEDLDIFPFGSLQGVNVPQQDNVYLGCDKNKIYFAEGYLDHVYIGKYYLESKFEDNQPVIFKIVKDASVHQLQMLGKTAGIDQVNSYSVVALVESLDDGARMLYHSFPIDLTYYKGGRYKLTATMGINDHQYKQIMTFNITDKPRFILNAYTPIIFKNNATKMKFNFLYDHAYRLNNQDLLYAAVAVKLTYSGADSPRTYYLVQDFIDKSPGNWLIAEDQPGLLNWKKAAMESQGEIVLETADIITESNVDCEIKYFYFKELFNKPDPDQAVESLTIYLAALQEAVYDYDVQNGLEYKLIVPVSGSATDEAKQIMGNIDIAYEIINTGNQQKTNGNTKLILDKENNRWQIELFYDDVLADYGEYRVNLSLNYQGITYSRKENIPVNWKKPDGIKETNEVSMLNIDNFSLLFMDKINDKVQVYLKYDAKNLYIKNSTGVDLPDNIAYTLYIKQGNKIYGNTIDGVLPVNMTEWISPEMQIPKEQATIKIVLKGISSVNNDFQFIKSSEIDLVNSISAPEVLITNSVDSLIPYNNVFFSWKGLYEDKYNQDIEYTYNFDYAGWMTPNSQWRSVRFYELNEGYHNFQIKAVYHNLESAVRSVTFFVDVHKPEFHPEKISIHPIYDADGVFYAVNIIGEKGAVIDASLREISVNGQAVTLGEQGAFETGQLALANDGKNIFTITAFDKVGNYTEYKAAVDNTITTLIFPDSNTTIRYSPLTLVGTINPQINNPMEIYVRDPFCTTSGTNKYAGWKKAKINTDRTFFVEDIFVNPGTREKELVTTLTMMSVFPSGKEFKKEIEVRANQIVMPIEMNLSAHALEGENGNTSIQIDCYANVDNISSWSIDFNGDGIYDVIELVNNPLDISAKSHSWEHKYSNLGAVKPRVRVITTYGNFFSVTDTVIIHERIKPPSNKWIENPISMDTVTVDKGTKELIFVLKKSGEEDIVEFYEVSQNNQFITLLPVENNINIHSLGINNAIGIKVLNKDHIFIAAHSQTENKIYQLVANQFGNYQIQKEVSLPASIKQMTLDNEKLYISFTDQNYLIGYDIIDQLLDINSQKQLIPEVYNTLGLGRNLAVEKDGRGLLVADYYNQRIIRFSPSLKMVEQFGGIGDAEKEFLKPSLITSYQNRVFVYDEGRKDIQVFDLQNTPICTLKYELKEDFYNYIDKAFFNDIAGISVITREEHNLLYYYVLILSRSTNQLALLRLPQWEELRAKVQNNKIVFIKNGEVYKSNPDGTDLSKLLSTDSLPRIEGAINYPALASDGKRLIFTSKKRLYNGQNYGYITENNEHAYDNLYLYDLITQELTRLDLGILTNYELERPVFNINSDKIIFSAKQTGKNWQIYNYNIRDHSVKKLFDTDENARFPYYSPNDRYIVFTTDYDGDEDIAIIDLKNPNLRYYITKNDYRDSFPVWSNVYPNELVNPDAIDPELEKVKTKIVFVSERGKKNPENGQNVEFHKGLYNTYLQNLSADEIQVYDIKNKEINSQDPDVCAVEITHNSEGDYPCFTGDGRSVLFEYFDGKKMQIKKFDYAGIDPDNTNEPGDINQNELKKETPQFVINEVEVLEGASQPAGMKNTITNFTAEIANGNEIILQWDPYTHYNIYYTVQFNTKSNDPDEGEKQVYGEFQAVFSGLTLGKTYFVRVCIIENKQVVATSQWLEVKMPKTVAKPSYEIDPANPYLVKLKAWTPDEYTEWKFTWIIENSIITENSGKEFAYHFATSGTKTVLLKATNSDGTSIDISDPMQIEIISDIEPVIEYELAEDSGSIDLNAEKSLGKNIDYSSAVWTISGPGRDKAVLERSKGTVDLAGFNNKININLTLRRIPVKDQSATDTLQKNIVVDLDFKKLKPVISTEVSTKNTHLIKFSGEQSFGNIDWFRANWVIFGNNTMVYQKEGVSTFEYLFPESNKTMVYTVSLTLPRKNDGMTETVSKVIDIEAASLEPVIDYEILTIKKDADITGYKIIFDCTKSRGNDIDFSQSRWSIPIDSMSGEQSVQAGPTAIFSLPNTDAELIIEVALTLFRRNGDAKTITKYIEIGTDKLPKGNLQVNESVEDSDKGKILILDVLKSTGPNINWERTEWFVDDQYSKKGPVVRIDIPASDINRKIPYTCTFYRYGADPEIYHGTVKIDKSTIIPNINPVKVSSSANNYYELDVLNSLGINIDWERTEWYLYDGNENVIIKRGAKITHAFAVSEKKMGYQVMVNMFLKGSTYPFIGYKNIEIEENELVPIIEWDISEEDANSFQFSAHSSTGANIDWEQTKWTFLDTSQSQYGPITTHKFPIDSEKRTYTVSLTLFRRLSNGQVESRSTTQEITIGSDKIVPKVKAKVYGDYLVLSADESEGRGLLLDRAVWLFPGAGDDSSYSSKIQGGIISKDSFDFNGNNYLKSNINTYLQGQIGTEFDIENVVLGSGIKLHLGGPNGIFFKTGFRTDLDAGFGLTNSLGKSVDVMNYDNYQDDTSSFSNSNMHTGAVCRRNVAGLSSQIVTLYVFRVESDGQIKGESITVRVDLNAAKASAGSSGVIYK